MMWFFCYLLPRHRVVILKSLDWLDYNLVTAGAIYLASKKSSQILVHQSCNFKLPHLTVHPVADKVGH
jgi:hypothetical protein